MRVPGSLVTATACSSSSSMQSLGATRDCSVGGPSCLHSASRPAALLRQRASSRHPRNHTLQLVQGRARKSADPEGYDPRDVRELTELMPDPQKDDLFDDIGAPRGADGAASGGLLDDDDDLFGEQLRGSGGGAPFGAGQYGGGQGGAGLVGGMDYSQGLGGAGGLVDDDYGLGLGYGAGVAGAGGVMGGYGGADEYEALDPQEARERSEALLQLDAMYDARMEWEMQQCQEMAFVAHHRIMSTAKNRYVMALRLARIMEQIELSDHYEGEPAYWLPSWVRSYYRLDAERVALNEAQQELESNLEAAERRAAEDDAYRAVNAALEVGLLTNPMQGGEGQDESGAADDGPDPLDEFLGEILPPSAAAGLGKGLGLGDDFSADILSVGPGGMGSMGTGEDDGMGGDEDDEDVFDLDDRDIDL